jgi:hypothetical protein
MDRLSGRDRADGEYVAALSPRDEASDRKGGRPAWSRDGKELFIVPGPGQLAAVTITTQPTFAFTPPVDVLRGRRRRSGDAAHLDIAADGRMVGVITSGQRDSRSNGVVHINLCSTGSTT